MALIITIAILISMARTNRILAKNSETVNSLARCETAINKIEREDRATIVDNSASRLHYTWLSQECEVQAGPEYTIRKYTFFKNGTFLLLRYHYIEESCSVATHTVIIRGSIKLLGPSTVISGATKTRLHVHAINVIPLNRQIAHKFGYRLNLTCGPQPKWRPYVSELIYEQPRQHSTTPLWQGPIYNSLQAHSSMKKRLGMNCLESLGIEFSELRLLRVQKKRSGNAWHFQLFLANPAPNVYSRLSYKPTSLQSTVMIRADTANDCPICNSVLRSNEFSPPLLHQVAALPALIGGYWHSERCESSEGGVWYRRQFQIYSGDKLWIGRWEYYDDPLCGMFLYAITAAGSYIQRVGRQKRHDGQQQVDQTTSSFDRFFTAASMEPVGGRVIDTLTATRTIQSVHLHRSIITNGSMDRKIIIQRQKKSLTDSIHQFLYDAKSSTIKSKFAAMLRGHRTYNETITRKTPSIGWSMPSGTTELDLHIAESILIPGDATVSTRCNADQLGVPLTIWPRNCVPRAIEAPSTLGLRAKLGVNWNGQCILLLGSRDDSLWEAPLRQCAQIPPRNPMLRAHLRRSVGLRFGLFPSSSTAMRQIISAWNLLLPHIFIIHFLR